MPSASIPPSGPWAWSGRLPRSWTFPAAGRLGYEPVPSAPGDETIAVHAAFPIGMAEVAAGEYGVPLERWWRTPGPGWPTVGAALLDGVNLVMAGCLDSVAVSFVDGLRSLAGWTARPSRPPGLCW